MTEVNKSIEQVATEKVVARLREIIGRVGDTHDHVFSEAIRILEDHRSWVDRFYWWLIRKGWKLHE